MGSYKMTVGNVEIVAVTDMNLVFPLTTQEVWPEVPMEAWAPYQKQYPDTFEGDCMRIEIGCYVVRSQGKTILVDTGYGPGPFDYLGGLRGLLMEDLAAQQVDPGEVDLVFHSHLHIDHVGWNTVQRDGKAVPTFPKARYLAHQADLEYFRKPEVQAAQSAPFMESCVESLVELGIFDTVVADTNLTDEVRAVHTPGHTPGHMSLWVTSQGQRAFIEGDVLIHPAQVTEQEWNSRFDADWPVSNRTRSRLLDQLESEGTTVIACHFPLPGFGRVVRAEGRRYWQVGL